MCPNGAQEVLIIVRFIVFFDVETTGTDFLKDEIVQVSAIKFLGAQEIDRFNTYIKPSCPIPLEATLVNGITDVMVANAPAIDDIKESFFDFINDAVLVGYNVSFDLKFISISYGGALDGVKFIDVMNWVHKYLDLPNYQLKTVAEHLGFRPTGSFHNALTDCEATSDIFWKLCIQELMNYSDIFHAPKQKKKKVFTKFRPKEIVPRATPTDTNHPLFGKKIVFTGDLSISRLEAAQMAVDRGALVRTSISGKTNYLVVGRQDIAIVGEDGMSDKEEKARDLNASGKASIEIIGEHEFMALLREVVQCG